MSSPAQRNILYDPRYAIEHVQTLPGVVPIRLFAMLFPLWYVETTATQAQGRPYELIEQYIERGIEEGSLNTAKELVEFFGLDSSLVEKILIFLETIGHISCSNDICSLTPLGKRSVQEGEKYTTKETRRVLYFDGFYSQPLLQEHYGNNLHIFSEVETDDICRLYGKAARGYQFHSLSNILHPWRPEKLIELGTNRDRAKYNLPEEVSGLRALQIMQVYFPMYIIEVRKQANQSSLPQYVVYTHIKGRRDTFFEQIINTSTDISSTLQAEKALSPQEQWAGWLAKKGLSHVLPEPLVNGMWRVVLPKEAFFTQHVDLITTSIGTFHLEHGYFLQIWCDDVQLRREAALDRTLKIIQRRRRYITKEDIEENLQIFAKQLQTRNFYLEDVIQRARETGKKDVLSTIDAL